MKKIFYFAIMAFALMAVPATLVSCGDDNEEVKPNNIQLRQLRANLSGTNNWSAGEKALDEIIQYINTQINGNGSNSLSFPAANKDKVLATLKNLESNTSWANAICSKSSVFIKVSLTLTLDEESVFDYSYTSPINAVGTYTGTEAENGKTWTIDLTDVDKTNPNNQGYNKVGTITVPEGVEIPAGEYVGEWVKATSKIYFYSDVHYLEEYANNNAYIHLQITFDGYGKAKSANINLRTPFTDSEGFKHNQHYVTFTN